MVATFGLVGCSAETAGDPDYAESGRDSPGNLVIRIEELQEQVATLEKEVDAHEHYDLEERIAELESDVDYLLTEMESVVDYLSN